MSLVFVLLPDPVARDRLRRALDMDRASRISHEVVFASDWDDLHQRVGLRPAGVAVVDPYGSGSDGMDRCAGFHHRFPSVALLPYAEFSPRRVPDVLRLAGLGVRQLVVRGQDDGPDELSRRVRSAGADGLCGAVLRALGGAVPPSLAPLVCHLLQHTGAPLCPDQAARVSFCHPKTLRAHLRVARLPSLNRLIVWTRLFHAAYLLGEDDRSVESVALALDFPSVGALRVQLRRYAGVCPQQVREGGGLAPLLRAFLAQRPPERRKTAASYDGSGESHPGSAR